MMKNKNGFTLIEVLMVSAVIGIMIAIAMPMYRDYMASSRLKGDAQNIYSLLQNAKMRAVRERSDVTVNFAVGGNPEQIQVTSGGAVVTTFTFTGTNSFGNGSATTAVPAAGVFGDGVTHAGNDFVFNSRGEIVGTSGYVYIQNQNGQAYAIGTLRPAGIINLRRWGGGAWR